MRHPPLLLAWVLAGLAAACPAPRPARPNLLLISIDTLRADHLGCYGYARPTSPNIDALARRGLLFERATSTSSWTLPAHTSILTGLYPAFHGLQDDGSKLSPDVPPLAEALRAHGYHTLAVVSHVYVSSRFGLERGFDRFDDSLIHGGAYNPVATQVVDRALELFDAAPAQPFFAFLHFFDPHWDYAPPPPFARRFTDPGYRGPIDGTLGAMLPYLRGDLPMPGPDLAQAVGLYDGEVAFVDEQIGRLLDGLERRGKLRDTVIVLTADHGEEFREHGRLGHGMTLYEEVLHVPLIFAGAAPFTGGVRRAGIVSLVDLAPTLLELSGADAIEGLQGSSLLDPGDGGRSVISESIRFGNEMRAVRQGRFKLLHYLQGDGRAFFDLQQDPREQHPLRDDPSGGALTERLARYDDEADRGWHLKLIAVQGGELRVRGTVRVQGRIVSPRTSYSERAGGRSRAEFARFELNDAGDTLIFEATVEMLMAEARFETSPPDAPVSFTLDVASAGGGAGAFLGAGQRVDASAGLTLVASDPRLSGAPADYRLAAPGCYIRAVPQSVAPGEESALSDEARRRLRALGYVD